MQSLSSQARYRARELYRVQGGGLEPRRDTEAGDELSGELLCRCRRGSWSSKGDRVEVPQ
jgi:hypothetical protein